MIHVTCRLTAKNRDQLQNPTLGNRVWATVTFTVLYTWAVCAQSSVYGGAHFIAFAQGAWNPSFASVLYAIQLR